VRKEVEAAVESKPDFNDALLSQLLKTNQRYQMFREGDGIVVGVSGGPDSLALLHALLSLRDPWDLKLVVVHVHHGLRGDAADADAAFVQLFCLNHEVPFYLFEADIGDMAATAGTSFEMEGRRFRYEAFDQVAQEENCSKIAVAQNLNDQCETVLMRLFRGAGLRGLGGILPVRDGRIIRPLIEAPRAWIESYCERWGLEPRQDHTNAETDYERNRIRLEVIPYLEANFNPGLAETLVRTASLLREEEALLERVAQDAYEKVKIAETRTLDQSRGMTLKGFGEYEPALRRRLIRCLAREACGGALIDFNYVHTEAVLELASSLDGSKALSLGALEAERVYDVLWMRPARVGAEASENTDWEVCVEEITREVWAARRGESEGIAVDLDRVAGPLAVRYRRPGDRFKPFGMQESKKLKRFMIDEKIPEAKRHKIPLICDENRIIWVYGYRMSEEVRVGPATERIGWLTLRRPE
jgi:tRNA(Ile)-lysidine synthase